MRLLVSVRSAEEVSAALAGGADIIDAKEPARGSLGRVTPAVLSAIAARTPASVPLSVRPTPPYAAIVLVNARETLALASVRCRCRPSASDRWRR